jgi:hypothetical protein
MPLKRWILFERRKSNDLERIFWKTEGAAGSRN